MALDDRVADPSETVTVDVAGIPVRRAAVAIGRKLSFGSHSETGAELAGHLYSVFGTLALAGLRPCPWLADYLQACAASGGRRTPAPGCPGEWTRAAPAAGAAVPRKARERLSATAGATSPPPRSTGSAR